MTRLISAILLTVSLSSTAAAQRMSRDCPHCPEMVSLPAGTFTMGAAPGEEAREAVDKDFAGLSAPQVRVTIGAGLSIGRYEVTRGQYAVYAKATGAAAGPSCSGLDAKGDWDQRKGKSWRDPGFAQTDDHPVVCVVWEDAAGYARWLSETTGKRYRLPSEAEWEYAARAGTTTARPWGDGRDGACANANVADRTLLGAARFEQQPAHFACADGHARTAPVGRFPANAFGLHDMLGNVWEWVEDCWTPNLTGAPADAAVRRDGDCAMRVARGTGWFTHPQLVRSANRYGVAVGDRDSDMGFRVVRVD